MVDSEAGQNRYKRAVAEPRAGLIAVEKFLKVKLKVDEGVIEMLQGARGMSVDVYLYKYSNLTLGWMCSRAREDYGQVLLLQPPVKLTQRKAGSIPKTFLRWRSAHAQASGNDRKVS